MTSQDAIYGSYLYQKKEKVIGELPPDSMMSSNPAPLATIPAISAISRVKHQTAQSANQQETAPESAFNGELERDTEVSKAEQDIDHSASPQTFNGLDKVENPGERLTVTSDAVSNGSQTAAGMPSKLAESGLIGEIVNNLANRDQMRSSEAYSLLLLMARGGAVQPLLRMAEEHPNEKTRLALIKLLGATGETEALRGLIHLAAKNAFPPSELPAALEAIEHLAGFTPGEGTANGNQHSYEAVPLSMSAISQQSVQQPHWNK